VWRYKQTVRSVRRAPEYAEYFVHYPIKQSLRSSHYYAQRMAGRGQTALDIGCGEGFFALELIKNGNRVTGVDGLPKARHSGEMERYIPVDLNGPRGILTRELAGQKFDRVLLLDVLEHLMRPERLLAEAMNALNPQGRLIVSLPNVANIAVRLALLFGRFTYTERGILDRTHLRFFTRKTARRFLEENGCQVLETRSTVIPLELALGLSPANPLMRAANALLGLATAIFPGLLGYQFVFLARPRE
jgi:2-polyprenyl-3-methyl-5-hydroxy-6-metoxy-1,4-benzoquinol methylase